MISVIIPNYNGEHILKECLSPNIDLFYSFIQLSSKKNGVIENSEILPLNI